MSLLWRANEFGSSIGPTVSTGFAGLDAELPGGGWPCGVLTELLSPQATVLEWRLLGSALRVLNAQQRTVVVIGPPKHPHLPGLRHEGIDEAHLIWIQASTPAERLWASEQLIKANACGAVIAWLPQARPEQIRRLQVCAQASDGLNFLVRPETARFEASASPLRVHATYGLDWQLRVQLLKRKGPAHDEVLTLPSVPGGLERVLTPRLRWPSRLFSREVADVVGSPAAPRTRRHAAAH